MILNLGNARIMWGYNGELQTMASSALDEIRNWLVIYDQDIASRPNEKWIVTQRAELAFLAERASLHFVRKHKLFSLYATLDDDAAVEFFLRFPAKHFTVVK